MTKNDQLRELLKISLEEMSVNFQFCFSGITRIKKFQYETLLRCKIECKDQNQFFMEPLNKFDIILNHSHKEKITNLINEYLQEYTKWSWSTTFNIKINTIIGEISVDEIIDELINYSLIFGIERTISCFNDFCKNTKFCFEEVLLIEGINVSNEIDFGLFKIAPSNSNFHVLCDDIVRLTSNVFFIDRSFLIKKSRTDKTICLPEICDPHDKSIKRSVCYNENFGFYYWPKINLDDASPVYIDLLRFSMSFVLDKHIIFTWRFRNLESNHFLNFINKRRCKVTKHNKVDIVPRTKNICIKERCRQKIIDNYKKLLMFHNQENEIGKRIIESISEYTDGLGEKSYSEKISKLKASFESLIKDRGSFGKKEFSATFSNFLSNDFTEKNEFNEQLSGFYKNARNPSEHKNMLASQVENDDDVKKYTDQAYHICKKCIQKCIDLNVLPEYKEQLNVKTDCVI